MSTEVARSFAMLGLGCFIGVLIAMAQEAYRRAADRRQRPEQHEHVGGAHQ